MDNTQDKKPEAEAQEQQRPQTEEQQEPKAEAPKEEQAPQAEAEAQKEEPKPEAEAKQQPDEVAQLKKQLAELNDKYIRTCAEYDNYRKRTAREKADLIKSAGSDIITALLPVIDDFDRAIAHMNDAQDVTAVKDGVSLILKKFNDYLAKRGVTVIETKELPLDTNVHEAITMVPAPTPEMKGKILDCVEKGYKLGDKVLRFAKVVVCQ